MKHNVLSVDDEPNVLEGLQRALCRGPHEVVAAHSGREALDILEGIAIDAIVVDQNMPGIKGADLLKHVREFYPDTVQVYAHGQGHSRCGGERNQ